jgi:hypothetical protein
MLIRSRFVLALLSILLIGSCHPVSAFDGTLTSEGQAYKDGYRQVQTELNLGKKFQEGLVRPYLDITYVMANTNTGINNPQVVYKVGSEFNPNLPLSFMSGVGYYQNLVRGTNDNKFVYLSVQYKFDTEGN